MKTLILKLAYGAGILIFAVNAFAAPSSTKKAAKTDQTSSSTQIQLLQTQVSALQDAVFQLELARNDNAYIDPAKPNKYSRADSSNGSFLISLDSIEPYTDGQKITFNIANLFSASYVGFTLTITYGERMSSSPADYTTWRQSLKTYKEDFTQTLYPGVWNKIPVVIAPLKAEDLGYISIVIATDQVSLRTYSSNGN